ncbi:MAG: beta-N-acetylhexosaminidase [Vulcanimicrobiaceae bacterium]
MNRRFAAIALGVLIACGALSSTVGAQSAVSSSDALGLVPQPRSVTMSNGTYTLPKQITIVAGSAGARNVAHFAQSFLRDRGARVASIIGADDGRAQIVLSSAGNNAGLGSEGYRLTVCDKRIVIAANAGAGWFYGLQTFEELFAQPASAGNSIRQVDIVDRPAYKWRGIMLDVSRHFFTVPVVERYLDVAAHYKLNTFHWHLTDDQGWRIQINRYPHLTEVGSCRDGTETDHDATALDGKRYCGFYTQAQIREVVNYAKQRYITVVPEIEMPGHSVAAVTAYPWLACTKGPFRVRETWGVSTDIYCPTDRTFTFLENVLNEVIALFPSTYIHIGGDEAPKDSWKTSTAVHALMRREGLHSYDAVQGYFDRRIERFLRSKGRRMVGWDEILDGGVTKTATVMSWRGEDGGVKAARRGNDVVMTPDGPLYFDAYQGDPNDEPEAIGGLTTTQMVYAYDPTPKSLTPQQAAHVLGIQGNVWTEYIPTPGHLFYMLLPRELALSEIAWTPRSLKDWDSFVNRSANQYAWLEAGRYGFRIPNPAFSVSAGKLAFANTSTSSRTVDAETTDGNATVTIADPAAHAKIYYTTDGSMPTAKSTPYSGPLQLRLKPGERRDITAVAVLPSGRTSTPSELVLRSLSKF